MSYFKKYLKIGLESILKQGKSISYPGDRHQVLNYDKVYNAEKGIYEYKTQHGSSSVDVVEINDIEDAKKVKIRTPFVREQDSRLATDSNEPYFEDGVLTPRVFK